MSLFGFLLLILVVYFFVWPLLRIGLKINAARKHYADMMNGMGADASSSQKETRRAGWSRRQSSRRKKIPADTGEYVAFDDIREDVANRPQQGLADDFVCEQQVEDAEWEEIR